MITVDQALQLILNNVTPLGSEEAVLDRALGRVLVQDITADMDLPPFDRARMDGYALRAADTAEAPARLSVIGEVAAGSVFERPVGAGEAVKIFTGAPIPHGCDAVQQVELTEAIGKFVIVKQPVEPRKFITHRASEVSKGDVVIAAGREIGPAEMSVLASFGYATVKVGVRPRVGVISTGSELVEVTAIPSAGQIRNSNSYTLSSYAARAGAVAERRTSVPDTVEDTTRGLESAAAENDVVITSGGVSMGDYDLVKEALIRMDAVIYFDKVRIRPGKPIVFARRGRTVFFGLPGNPVSTSVTFNLFVRTALRVLQGDAAPQLPIVTAAAIAPIKDPSDRRSYLPARLSIRSGRAVVESLKWGGSSDLAAFVNANALIVVPEDVHEILPDHPVDVVVLNPW